MTKKKRDPELPIPGLEPYPEGSGGMQDAEIQRVEEIFRSVLGHDRFSIVWTENIYRFMSVEIEDNFYSFRMHKAFLHAPRNVLEAAAGYAVRKTKKRKELLHTFIETKAYDESFKSSQRKIRLNPHGKWFNLQEILDRLNERYFDPPLEVSIGWGRRRSTTGKRRIILGSYNAHTDTIRIHPVLDDPSVPVYAIEYIVYHEMVHASLKDEVASKQTTPHGKEFYARLYRYEAWKKAEEWEQTKLQELLSKPK